MVWVEGYQYHIIQPGIEGHQSPLQYSIISWWPRECLVVWPYQLITWTNVDLSSMEFCVIHLTTIYAKRSRFHNMSLKITLLKVLPCFPRVNELTHWGRVTHICVGKLTIIGSNNGLSPGRRQAITWTNVRILLIRPLGTNFSEFLIGIQTFSFTKMHLKMSSAKWRPFVSASMC